MKLTLPPPAPQYDRENEAQTRRTIALEDSRNVKTSDYATATKRGVAKVDGTTIAAAADGTLSAVAGGSGINQLTGDVTAGPGVGSVATTLSATGVVAGTFGDTTHVGQYTVDAKGRITGAASVAITQPAGANPTATASDVAVNGAATSFMRSDAAPAVQKASAAVFGVVKVDGSSITATGGVISSSGGSTGANPTATAKDTAVNGAATTFMRSDAAPAIQKASSSQYGVVKPDGTTIVDNGSGVLSGAGGGSSGVWTSVVSTVVQAKATPTTSAIDTTGAKLIVVLAAAASGGGQPYAVTDSKSNTFTALTARTGSSSTMAQLFYCINPTVGSGHTFTLTANGGVNTLSTLIVWAFSWSGASVSYIAENGAGTGTSGTALTLGVVNPAAAASYLGTTGLCLPTTTAANNPTTSWNQSIGAGFSSGNFNGGWMSWKITGSTEQTTWTWNTTAGAAAAVALFKGA